MPLRCFYNQVEGIHHHIGMELPLPASKNIQSIRVPKFHLTLCNTNEWRQFLTLSDANNEVRPIGMKMSPITVNIEMACKTKIKSVRTSIKQALLHTMILL